MPVRTLPAPLLSLATSCLNGLETVDADNLSCMWTSNFPVFYMVSNPLVFTKCAQHLENGRRLENISWRLWYQEAHFFDDPSQKKPSPVSFDQKSTTLLPSPSVAASDRSESVDPASTQGHVVDHDITSAVSDTESHANAQPSFTRRESSSRRPSVKHFSTDSFKSLIESLEPPTAELEKWKAQKATNRRDSDHSVEATKQVQPVEIPVAAPAVPTDIPQPRSRLMSESHGSASPVSSSMSARSLQRVSSSIVRGFTPENPSISRRLPPPEPEKSEHAPAPENQKRPKFFIASSLSDSEDEYTVVPNTSIVITKPATKSSLSPPAMKRAASNGSAKKTHFDEVVDTKILPEPPTDASEDEDEDSAVMSDDEDDDWEDSQSDIENAATEPGFDEHLFDKREDTHPTSGPSILSNLFKSKSDYNLSSQAYRHNNNFARTHAPPTPPTPRPLQPISPQPERSGLRIPQLNTGLDATASSPRTLRKRMLATELSESLRRNLLWERQHRSVANNTAAALKRRHTSNDLARLKDFPEGLSGKGDGGPESGKYAFDTNDAVW